MSVIYNRISSINQNKNNNSVSLYAQERRCSKYAEYKGLKILRIYKEVHSAYKKTPPVLSEVIGLKNVNIIITCVDRFSRSVLKGIRMAETAVKNGNTLMFVSERLSVSKNDDIMSLKKYLITAEKESAVIGHRIKQAKKFLSENGLFAGGCVPFGYEVMNKELFVHEDENAVIEFIETCQKNKIRASDLNSRMRDMYKGKYDYINCYDEDGDIISVMDEPLTDKEISDLLNSYKIPKRGGKWNPSKIRSAIKSHNKYKNTAGKKRKFMNLSDMSSDISNISSSSDESSSSSSNEPPKKKRRNRNVKKKKMSDKEMMIQFKQFRMFMSQ